MSKEKRFPKDADGLCRQAESRQREKGPETDVPCEGDARRMLHELQVHQIELELQNEELKQAREELEKQFAKYSDLYNFAPVGYFTLDGNGAIREANLSGAKLLGIDRPRLVGSRFALLVSGNSRPTFDLFLTNVLRGMAAETCEVALQGDRLRSLQIEGITTESVTGQAQQCRLAVIDITQRKQVEETLRQSEQRYHLLFEHMLDGFAYCKMLFDDQDRPSDFIYLDVNEAFGRLTGLKDVTYKKVTEVIPGIKEAHPELFEIYGRVALTGRPERFEIEFTPLDMWLSVSVFSTEREHFVAVFDDITKRKRAELLLNQANTRLIEAKNEVDRIVEERTSDLTKAYENLRIETEERHQAEAQLRQSQKMEAIGTLAGGIAHDFNNILAAIIGFGEMARDKTPEESLVWRYMDKVVAGGIRGRELVKRILAFSRHTDQEKRPINLAGIVTDTLTLIRASLPTTIDIRTDIETEFGFILADPIQIHQIIMNLCTNAAHAMRRTGGTICLHVAGFTLSSRETPPVSMMLPGLYSQLSVMDTGEGMSSHTLEHIFDPFFTTKAPGEGTGLGLSVVHGIVKSHGGTISVSSKPGNGSAFTVYLPMISQDQPRAAGDGGNAIPRGHERILFIDDEEDLAAIGYKMLTGIGYRVTQRTGPREALALFRLDPSQFDLVITDQTMPEMTGMDLIKEILTLRTDIPIIMCTGFSHLVDADSAKAAGIRSLVMKPLTKREIAVAVRKALDE